MQPNTFVWNELMTTDGDKAARFYAALFGWSTKSVEMADGMRYTIFQRNGEDVGGMMKMDGPQWQGVPSHWMTYVAVEDVDATAAKARSAGGTICVEPFDVPTVGRMAVVTDPTGATLSFIKFSMPA